MTPSERNLPTPLWFKILTIILMLPAAGFPLLLSTAGADSPIKLLLWLYPAYVIVSGVCAIMCYQSRNEISWILLALMLLSHAGIYYLALCNPPI